MINNVSSILLVSDKTFKGQNTLDVVACTVPQAGGVARPLEGWLNAKPCRVRGAQCSVRWRTPKGAKRSQIPVLHRLHPFIDFYCTIEDV